jgi:hypothetical protein
MADSLKTQVLNHTFEWKNYIEPPDNADADQCRSIDKYNQGVFQVNNHHAPEINELLTALRMPLVKVTPPPNYYERYQKQYNEFIRQADAKSLLAIKYLAERGKYACRDYEISDAAKLADDIAEQEFTGAQTCVDITPAVGYAHRRACTCNNEWDGRSQKCKGLTARIKWVRGPTHHFLQPDMQPTQY